MNYKRLEILELILCELTVYKDDRGFVYESFKKESFNNFVGYNIFVKTIYLIVNMEL